MSLEPNPAVNWIASTLPVSATGYFACYVIMEITQ